MRQDAIATAARLARQVEAERERMRDEMDERINQATVDAVQTTLDLVHEGLLQPRPA